MDRINSQTKSAILFESLFYLDKYENERIALYKSLVTANRIQISIDIVEGFVSISAILPIASVDPDPKAPSIPIFPVWNRYVAIPSFTDEVIDYETNSDDEYLIPVTAVITIVAYDIFNSDRTRPNPRKNISITLDKPNLKAKIEAILPCQVLWRDRRLVILPLD
jgi:hypothetical protein